jgi:hypothetical protein
MARTKLWLLLILSLLVVLGATACGKGGGY